ncbi:protein of unknown function [Rhodovastum atsumiense]|nr:protein of unknown function [Rhodovastum atsumiense]
MLISFFVIRTNNAANDSMAICYFFQMLLCIQFMGNTFRMTPVNI